MKLFKKSQPQKKEAQYKLEGWREMYENGGRLRLAAAISAEVARLVTLELESSVYGSKRADVLNEAYREVVSGARYFCEIACAFGGVMLKPYIERGKIKTAIIPSDSFEITASKQDGTIVGARFFERIERDGRQYVKSEEHMLLPGSYLIINKAYIDADGELKEIALSEVDAWSDIEQEAVISDLDIPLFSYFKMPSPPTNDIISPLGAPIYARAVELIEDANKQYERLLWEFESGERALYIDETAVRRGSRGEANLPDKRLYRMLATGNDELFEDWTPVLRDGAIINGFDRILKRIEFNCGLAYGTLSDPNSVDKTAEEIRTSKQRSFATVTEIQTALKKAMLGWISAANALVDIYDIAQSGEYKVDFAFDDSIVADRTTEFDERMRLLNAGVISAEEIRRWYLGEGAKNNE
ncbi:MAG: phage portal protein [Clostridia bacterium]|nr:phage portal protein [Clostridia bacterium]